VTTRPGEPSTIWFHFSCQDPELTRLALDALNVYRVQQFALRRGLPFDEVLTRGDVRAFALLVDTGRLEETLLGLRVEGVSFGPVECGDRAALEICRELGVAGRLGTPAGPALPARGDAP
jgi:hypothetical protein